MAFTYVQMWQQSSEIVINGAPRFSKEMFFVFLAIEPLSHPHIGEEKTSTATTTTTTLQNENQAAESR